MQEQKISKREASLETGYGLDRDYGVGAQILHDLGLRRIQLLTNHPPKVAALEGFALEVVGNVALGQPAHLKDSRLGAGKPVAGKERATHLKSALECAARSRLGLPWSTTGLNTCRPNAAAQGRRRLKRRRARRTPKSPLPFELLWCHLGGRLL